jgi:hypothetical protein
MDEKEKLDQFALDLLEKTIANKLVWHPLADPEDPDGFSVDLGKNFSFQIRSVVHGKYRTIALQLWKDQIPMLESMVNNNPRVEIVNDVQQLTKRFRLYSDLFDAVRESVYGGEQTLSEVEELLRKIG